MHWTVSSLPVQVSHTTHCKRRRLMEQETDSAAEPICSKTFIGNMDAIGNTAEGLEQERNDKIAEKPVKFSQQLIAFTLFGTQRQLGIARLAKAQLS